MLSVVTTSQFRKSLKKLAKSGSFDQEKVLDVIQSISMRRKLSPSKRDHSLTGKMSDFRECHIESDLLLIYQITDNDLVLANIGSHAELFG